MTPWRVSKPGDEGTGEPEAHSWPFPWGWEAVSKASSTGRPTHHPQGSHEHWPSCADILALGLCEGQEILHSHEIIFLPYCFSFPNRKEKLVSTLVVCSGVAILVRSVRGVVSMGGHVALQGGGAEPPPHLSEPAPGQALHFPAGLGSAHRREWVGPPRKTCIKDKVRKPASRRQNPFITWTEPSHSPWP